MERRLGNAELQGLWVQLMQHLATNPLGGLEVVKAGATEVVMKSIAMHSELLPFALMAVKMLRQVASEPAHATTIAENGAPPMMLTLLKQHELHPELTLNCIGLLANLAQVTSIHRLIVTCDAIPAVIAALHTPQFKNNEPVVVEGCRFLCFLCRNEANRNAITSAKGPELVVDVLRRCLVDGTQPPMEFCIETIYHLAQLHFHRKVGAVAVMIRGACHVARGVWLPSASCACIVVALDAQPKPPHSVSRAVPATQCHCTIPATQCQLCRSRHTVSLAQVPPHSVSRAVPATQPHSVTCTVIAKHMQTGVVPRRELSRRRQRYFRSLMSLRQSFLAALR
jgi:hypothetical protein